MRPFWSLLESHAKLLKVQSALSRFGRVLWLVYVFFARFSRHSLGRIAWWAKRTSAGKATCGTASLQSNCPNQDRLQLTCLFPSRVSVSRTIKPILETGCCAKQRPPDFFSQKVTLFSVTGIKWIIYSPLWVICVLLYECFTGKYTPRKIHKNYIRDPSGLFSIISHVSLSMT